eukprot:scaffold1733_cov123-Isochrysis_galbana.AAC.1
MIGRAPGGKVKGGGGKGGKASLPGDSRVSRRIRPLALLIFFFSMSRPVVVLVLRGRPRCSRTGHPPTHRSLVLSLLIYICLSEKAVPIDPGPSKSAARRTAAGCKTMQYEIVVPVGVRPGQTIQVDLGGQRVSIKVPEQLLEGRKVRVRAPAPVNSTQMFRVIVPPGVSAGMTFQANMGGRVLAVMVPPGHGPGSTLTIKAPAAAPPTAPPELTYAAPAASSSAPKPTATDILKRSAAKREAGEAKREADAQARGRAKEQRTLKREASAAGRMAEAAAKFTNSQSKARPQPAGATRNFAACTLQPQPQSEASALWWLNMGL